MGIPELTAYRSHDAAEILEVLQNPAILKTITEDGGKMPNLDTNATCFVVGRVDGEIAACFVFEKLGAVTIDIHAHVLPHQRQHSKDLGAVIMRFILEHAKWANKYVAQVPFCYENVRKYAESFGLKIEGINRESYLKNGQIFDKWHLGATAQEIRDELDR